MGYPKQYDRDELLDRAVELFRRQGFNGTSTAELTAELGVNRKSMYAEFGSKQGLFEAALERYAQKHLTRVLAALESPEADTEEIKQAFLGYAEAGEGRFRGLGCLMCNTAVERAALDPGSARFVASYFERFNSAFRHALLNARLAGGLDPDADLDEIARFLTTCMVGVSASIRAEAPREQLWATYRVVVSLIDDLMRAAAPGSGASD